MIASQLGLIAVPLLVLSQTPLAAQSMSSLQPKAPSSGPVEAAPAAAPSEPKSAPAEMNRMALAPSRHIGEVDRAAYVASMSAMLEIHAQKTDPFGQFQDPDSKPIVKVEPNKPRRAPTVQVTPFKDVVELIRISTVMPGERRFLVGNRSIGLGDQIPLSFRGKPIQVQVIEVSSSGVGFKNVETGETASLKLDLLPAGMTPGLGAITAPGMVPQNENAPLMLDGGSMDLDTQRTQ